MSDPLGQSQVLPYLGGLSKAGYQISILSVEKRKNFKKRAALIRQITEEQGIAWHYLFYNKRPPVLSTLLDLQRLISKARALHKKHTYDIVHCRSYIAALVGLGLKQRYGVPFIFDMRGFWADERVDGQLWNLRNPIYKWVFRYFKAKEKDFLQNADYTISLTHNAKEVIESWQLPGCAPIQVIPCCVDTDLFDPRQVQRVSKEEPFTVSYLGSIGTWYMLDEMLTFYGQLLKARPDSRFLFITTEDPEIIQRRARELDVATRAMTIQKAERKEVPHLLAKSHLSIYFVKPLFSKKASSPTKMGEILAMGIPMVTNSDIGDHNFLFDKYTCGTLIPFEAGRVEQSPEQLKVGFEKAIGEIDELMDIPVQELREVALSYYSLEEGVKKYQAVYAQLLKSYAEKDD